MNEQQRADVIKWLLSAEHAFGEVARVFDDMSNGEAPTSEDLIQYRDISQEFESQARKLRAAIAIPPSERIM